VTDVRDRLTDFVKALPVAHRVVIVSALAALAMLAVLFLGWVTTPSYTVLYSGLDDKAVASAIEELDTLGVPYKLEGGGRTILVPREALYETRASLAGAGVSGAAVPQGYELMDSGGLSVSDFRQRVDYQRALEGELAKTLLAMNGINSATVRLVLPQKELFADQEEPATASVLLDPARPLDEQEVETITFLVSSAVEGLSVDRITVADADGSVLHAPGDAGGASVQTNRNLRQTREFEQALAGDITKLLGSVGGAPASVVVRAALNFDAVESQTETYDPESAVALKQQESAERFEGTGAALATGAVGVDGQPLIGEGGETNYERDENVVEFGVDKTQTQTILAPGRIEKLSVAIVMDDGTVTGVEVPPVAEVEQLVAAALGLEPARGDSVAVSTVALPAPEEPEEEVPAPSMLDLATQIVAVVVLFIVSLALFLMTRRRKASQEPEVTWEEPVTLPAPAPAPEPALVTAELPTLGIGSDLQREVTALVERQPEEIATLLRSWLADRRG
jgi:flagellar M-ring protein FliF